MNLDDVACVIGYITMVMWAITIILIIIMAIFGAPRQEGFNLAERFLLNKNEHFVLYQGDGYRPIGQPKWFKSR